MGPPSASEVFDALRVLEASCQALRREADAVGAALDGDDSESDADDVAEADDADDAGSRDETAGDGNGDDDGDNGGGGDDDDDGGESESSDDSASSCSSSENGGGGGGGGDGGSLGSHHPLSLDGLLALKHRLAQARPPRPAFPKKRPRTPTHDPTLEFSRRQPGGS